MYSKDVVIHAQINCILQCQEAGVLRDAGAKLLGVCSACGVHLKDYSSAGERSLMHITMFVCYVDF